MKRNFVLLALFAFLFGIFSAKNPVSSQSEKNEQEFKPHAQKAAAFGISEPVGSFAPARPETGKTSRQIEKQNGEVKEVKNKERVRAEAPNALHDADNAPAQFQSEQMPAPNLSFEGLSSNDNAAAYGFRPIPPDPTGDVGPNHYVQAVNVLLRVFDKAGTPQTPPVKLSSIFAPLNTQCARRDDGDPIIQYDQLADRWFLSVFCTAHPPFRQMIAVSQTGNPAGSYFVYEFVMPNFKLNDYSKFGVWRDAYFMTTDQFVGSDFAGTGAFAFDREKMLAGDPSASYIYFDLATPTLARLGGMLPADLDGLQPPPPQAPGIFVSYTATEYGEAQDAIKIFEFRPVFHEPALSTFTERAESPIAVAAFDPTSPPERTDIAQPAPGVPLDSQSDRLMYRVAYRNLGDSESLVFNQTVRTTPAGQGYQAGVRLYELRKYSNSASQRFVVQNQFTIGDTNASRWMASAAQDFQGNLAVGYSLSSSEKKPSIAYSGRAVEDAPNTVRADRSLHEGTGVQTAFGFRWGDYSTMVVDSTDGCTFWYTNEYYSAESQQESQFGWKTRVGNFKFPTCQKAPLGIIQGVITNAQTGQPIPNAVIRIGSDYHRNTDANGNYKFFLPPGTYSLFVSARGFDSRLEVAAVTDEANVVRNFALNPNALMEAAGVEITAESCNRNFAVEPGETVTVNLSLKNNGNAPTGDLIVGLQSGAGLINLSAPQNYGAISVGQTVSRSFTFTAAPNLSCGEQIVLMFRFLDGAQMIGVFTQTFNVGTRKIALSESFNNSSEPNLPPGWSTSAAGAQEFWKSVLLEPANTNLAAFSDEAISPSVNELVSPIFQITSRQAQLTFRNKYDLESTFLRNKFYDGAVLEIRYNRGQWRDILQAGGSFESGGYDGVLDASFQNPLGGRLAWSSKSGINSDAEFVLTRVNLPVSAAGKKVQFRWRVGTDIGGRRQGQWIDNVEVQDGYVCSACSN
ncbi:MAG: carboxypeptidase regulatory-like domain-containing protein [Acidobacteriota bacterium]|nr:carboxypeptidase regulatory-like domain-containing protein [Acidobacteriota bacterium]